MTALPVVEGSPLDLANFTSSAEEAITAGLEVLVAKDNELFLDIDDGLDTFFRVLDKLRQLFGVYKIERWKSRSGTTGHWHLRIEMLREYSVEQRVALQACLGSDPVKEMLTIGRELFSIDEENRGKTVRLFRQPGTPTEFWDGTEWQRKRVLR